MKIVFVTTCLDRGGAEILLLSLVKRLTPEHDVHVLYYKGKGTLIPSFVALGVVPLRFSLYPSYTTLDVIRTIRRWFEGQETVIIQGWMYQGSVLATLLHFLYPRQSSLYWSIHHSAETYTKGLNATYLKFRLCAFLSKHPKKVIFVSNEVMADHIAMGFCPKNAIVINNGIDTDVYRSSDALRREMRKELSIAEDDLVIGAVGRSHPVKDYRTFFRCVNMLLPRYPQLHVVVAGRGVQVDESIKISAKDRARIHLLGERQDTAKVLAAMDVYALTSLSESFSLSLLEALSTGLCCVASDVIHYHELFPASLRIFPKQDVDKLVEALDYFLRMSADQRRAIGLHSHEVVRDIYSLNQMQDRYIATWQGAKNE